MIRDGWHGYSVSDSFDLNETCNCIHFEKGELGGEEYTKIIVIGLENDYSQFIIVYRFKFHIIMIYWLDKK